MKKGTKEGNPLEKVFQSVKKEKVGKEFIEERPVYFDGRQYSFKIPKSVMDYIKYKKGDRIRFTVSGFDGTEMRVKMEYVQK
jgi:hypothetical protein